MITKQAHEEANIIWGAAFDETMEDELSVTVIATGFTNLNGEEVPSIAASAAPGEPKPAVAAPAPASSPASDNSLGEEDFVDIISIFNRK